MNDMITIPREEYLQLLTRNLELGFLESTGVDNWCGYYEGYSEYIQDLAIELEVDPFFIAENSDDIDFNFLANHLINKREKENQKNNETLA